MTHAGLIVLAALAFSSGIGRRLWHFARRRGIRRSTLPAHKPTRSPLPPWRAGVVRSHAGDARHGGVSSQQPTQQKTTQKPTQKQPKTSPTTAQDPAQTLNRSVPVLCARSDASRCARR